MRKVTLDITGMHCQSCVTLLTKSLEKQEGVKYVNVNLTTEKATVEFDETKTRVEEIIRKIKDLGYDGKLSGGESFDKEERKRRNHLKRLRNLFIFSLIFAVPAFFNWNGIHVDWD